MPVSTTIRPQFAKAVKEITEGLTNEQVAVRAGISAEYVRKMRQVGLVPTEQIIRKLADGFADKGEYLNRLLVAAGYEGTNPEQAVRNSFRENAPLTGYSFEHWKDILREEFDKIEQAKKEKGEGK